MTILERIAELRRDNGNISINKLEAEAGLTRGSMCKWDKHEPTYDKLKRVADCLGVSVAYLKGETDIKKEATLMDSFDNIYPIQTKLIRLLGDIACGEPIIANQEYEVYVECNTDIKADFALRAKGDSMINARIYDGDIVFIRKQETVNNGEIAAVIIDDEATLKRGIHLRLHHIKKTLYHRINRMIKRLSFISAYARICTF